MYNDDEPNVFHLLFPKYEMVLESETEQDAKEWVEKIKDGESLVLYYIMTNRPMVSV